MNCILKEYLSIYKNLTLNIIKCLEHNKFDSLDILITQRQDVIDNINNLNYSKQEFSKFCDEFKLSQLEKSAETLIKEKKEYVKNEIINTSKGIKANNNYNKGFYNNAGIFSKKV